MFRAFIAAAFTVLALALPAHAAEYNDPEGRFSVTLPEGWVAERPPSPLISLIMASDKSAPLGGVCLVMAKAVPETASAKQSEIDEAFGAVLTKEFWETSFKTAGAKDVTVEDAGSKQQDGRTVYYVVASLTRTTDKGDVKVKGKQVVHVIPGSLQFINCSAIADKYAELEEEFEAIFASYKAKSGDYIARAPMTPPSVLTLYTGAGYDGTARVVAQNMPNVALLGMPSASVAVAGLGQWEVCEGANFSGACQVVAAGISSDKGQMIRVGSVRRYLTNTKSVTGVSGIVSTNAGVLARMSAERVR